MAQTLSIFGLQVYGWGLFAAIGAALCLIAAAILGRKTLPKGTVCVYGILACVFGLILSRVVYCLVNLSQYTEVYENPALMLRFWDGGFSMTGLMLGCVLAVALSAKLMKVRMSAVADAVFAPMGLWIAALRLGERYTDIGVGKAVEEGWLTNTLPFLFLQEKRGKNLVFRIDCIRIEAVIALLIAVVVVLFFLKKGRKPACMGDAALLFFILFGTTQVLLESMHDDRHMLFIVYVRFGQVGAIASLFIASGIAASRWVKAGGNRKLIPLLWGILVVGLGCIAALEFSLDGRLTWGVHQGMTRDYLLMAGILIVMSILPIRMLNRSEAC